MSHARPSIDEVHLYDSMYSEWQTDQADCLVSCTDLEKASRRVGSVLRSLEIGSLDGSKVLDVGCGLGFFSEALRRRGARVRGIDSSAVAIGKVRERFSRVETAVGSFPADCPIDEKYDLIWANDFPLINTFDVDFICREFVGPSFERLAEGGSLVIGSHSNFSGSHSPHGWAYWPLPMIEALQHAGGLSGPRVIGIDNRGLGRGVILLGRLLGKEVPFTLHRTR
jgi:SAM-dependent methyltransferase